MAPESIEARLANWAQAKIAAAENTRILLAGGSSSACAERMKTLESAEQGLLELSEESGLPDCLKRWLSARKDSACPQCLLSGGPPTHPECQGKLDEYYASEAELLQSLTLMN